MTGGKFHLIAGFFPVITGLWFDALEFARLEASKQWWPLRWFQLASKLLTVVLESGVCLQRLPLVEKTVHLWAFQ